jgi:uncharacterized membrane protein YdjX (TVP38/TMEM64 family)
MAIPSIILQHSSLKKGICVFKKKFAKKIVLFGALLIVLGILYYCGIGKYLTIDYIKGHQQAIQEFIKRHPFLAALCYSSLYASLIFLMIPLTLLLSVAAGFFFEPFTAALLSTIGALVGGSLSLLTIRYLLSDWLHARHKHAIEKFQTKFKEHGARYLLSLILFPVTPFPVITIAAGLSEVSFFTFLWTVAVGIIPLSLACAFAGKQFANITSVHDILSPSLLLSLAILSLLAFLPTLIDFIRGKKHKK